MKYILDAKKLQAAIADLTPEERGKYILIASIELVTGHEMPWAKKQPKPRSTKTIGPYTEDFQRFWKAYPDNHRVGKGGAFIEWKKIVEHEPEVINKILIALEWQKIQESWIRENGKYIPNPETYLAKRRWEDEQPIIPSIEKQLYQDMNGIWRQR